jgi:hypothetical protein
MNGMEGNISKALGILSLPVTLIIDDSGKVVQSQSHFGPDLQKAVDEMLTPKPRK